MSEPQTSINDQVTDAVAEAQAAVLGASETELKALGYRILVHSVTLAMQDAVAQQQQRYTLNNAITAAVSKAVLEADAEELGRLAEAVKVLDEINRSRDVSQTLAELKALLDSLPAAAGASDSSAKG